LSNSEWLANALGAHAPEILAVAPASIAQAHTAAANAQEVGGLRQRTTFGSTFSLAVHDAFVRNLGGLEGVGTFKPSRASYSLVVVGEVVLFPLLWAHDLSEPITEHRFNLSALRQQILGNPSRGGAQLAFDFAELADEEGHDLWEQIQREHPAVRRVVVLTYAAGYQSGLLSLHIGEGYPLADGDIRWSHLEAVDITDHIAAAQPAFDSDEPVARFDAAPLPDPFMRPRSATSVNPEADDVQPAEIDKTETNE
jgi:hypothetical protein